ncbi:MAG: RND family efflux transporter MFP subunit [Candidatus Krumholzibacteriia bacterium]|jgi:RND family efflux transporter MFP subunit
MRSHDSVPTLLKCRFLLAFASLFIATLLVAGCSGGEGDGSGADSTSVAEAGEDGAADSDSTKAKEPTKEKSIRVNVGEIRRGDLVLPVYADGAIRTPQSVSIKTKVGGELLKVLVRDGDRVRKGQVIARIDSREYEISLEESRYRHLEALSQMAAEADTFVTNDKAMTDFRQGRDNLDDALKRGSITREEHQSKILELEMNSLQAGAFRNAVFQQRTGLADARMAEERAKLNLEYTAIKAPFSGIVQGLIVVAGEMLTVNSPVCTVFNNENLEAVVNVLEADLGHLAEGRPVLLAIPATGDTLQAVIDVISPTLDEATRTCELLIRFDNPEGRFRPGMFVRAQIAGIIFPDKLLAPKASLLIRDNRPLVFKREDDRARWLYVDVGLQNEEWVEILKVHSGGSLAPGEEVVVSDHLTLAHEAKIKVRKHINPVDRWEFATEAAASGASK